MRVRITLEYDYEGDETDMARAEASEIKDWSEGNVGVLDVIAMDDDATTFKVEVFEPSEG